MVRIANKRKKDLCRRLIEETAHAQPPWSTCFHAIKNKYSIHSCPSAFVTHFIMM